jgi:hypothetical protein
VASGRGKEETTLVGLTRPKNKKIHAVDSAGEMDGEDLKQR